jgi:hypothetical protein
MPQPLILTWATTTSGWTQRHLRCAQLSSLGESTHIRDYPWALEAQPWLGNPIFGTNFWDPHRKRYHDSIFDSKDSGRIFLKKSHV